MGNKVHVHQRLKIANEIIEELQLFNSLEQIGTPVLVGATAYGLIVNPDIDIEIYCIEPKAEEVFLVLSRISQHSNVKEIKYKNCIDTPDQGLYFQIKYLYSNQQLWKIDMWLLPEDHPGPTARDLLKPMLDALTDETREAIIEIKKCLVKQGEKVPSIYIYQAVLDYQVQNLEDFYSWYADNNNPIGLTSWIPKGSTTL